MKIAGLCGCLALALAWHGPVRADDQKPVPVQLRFPKGDACPESPMHVYGGGPLKFTLAVEAPLGTHARVVADLFQLATGGVAAPLQRDVPVTSALSFEDRTYVQADCLLPALPAVRRKTTLLLKLKAATDPAGGAPVGRTLALIVYPAAGPDAWMKTVAARLEHGGLRRLAVFGEGSALRPFLRSRKVAFDDLGEDWPGEPDAQTLYLGETHRLPPDNPPGVRTILFLPRADDQSLPPGVYQSADARGGTFLKVTLPLPSADDPAALETFDEILRRALEPRLDPQATNP